MAPTTKPLEHGTPVRRLRLVAAGSQRGAQRDAAYERVRDARRRLQPRHERFAHLTRMHD